MIDKKDVIRLKIPFPNIDSGLALKSHMYICKKNVNYDKELKIRSLLFKNYESFIKIMLLLDGVINSGNKILNFENKDNEDEIKLKNYISDENRFDLYINDRYIETMHYNITLNEGTKKLETVDQRLRKILS